MGLRLLVAACVSLAAPLDAARPSVDLGSAEGSAPAAGHLHDGSLKLDSAVEAESAARLHQLQSSCPHPFDFPTSCWESILPDMDASQSQAYIREHSLHSVLSETVTDVILQRPAAPWQLLGERFLSRAHQGQVYFVRDDHTTPEEQINLAGELHRFAGGSLWLEFFYEEQLAKVRAAFASPDKADDAVVLRAVQEAVSNNGWSSEFNAALTALLRVANRHGMSIHALDSPEWSLEAFTAKHGKVLGFYRYWDNRRSSKDDGQASTSRWVRKVLAERGSSTKPVVVLGGAEHGPVMRDILKEKGLDMQYLFESYGEIQAAAKRKLEGVLEEGEAERAAEEGEVSKERAKLTSAIALWR